jgi:hypothetical protein
MKKTTKIGARLVSIKQLEKEQPELFDRLKGKAIKGGKTKYKKVRNITK